MTVCDVLIQVMAELTGEPEKDIASFVEELKERSPNKILNQALSPKETEILHAALREGGEGPVANLVQETVAAFRSSRRGS